MIQIPSDDVFNMVCVLHQAAKTVMTRMLDDNETYENLRPLWLRIDEVEHSLTGYLDNGEASDPDRK